MRLADLASCSGAYPKPTDDLSNYVRQAHKMVLPDDTLRLVQHIRSQLPPVINHLRRLARPPFPLMFVEADLGEYIRALGKTPEADQEQGVTGLLIIDRPDAQMFVCHVIDSTTAGAVSAKSKVLHWPIRFSVAYGALPHPLVPADIPDRVEHVLWGYDPSINIAPLHRMAWGEPDSRLPMDLGVAAMRETQGVLRYAIAIMSLLNGPAEITNPESHSKPRTVMLFQQPRRLCTPSIIRIDVPKRVRDPGAYVLKMAREGTRKRLHDVRGHYRHVTRPPATAHAAGSPWEPCDGGWRRWIDNHERGDQSLGDLRHRTIVPVVPHAEHQP